MLYRRFAAFAALVPILTASCSDPVSAPKPATVTPSSTQVQMAFAGSTVNSDPEVTVLTESGAPVIGVTVTFTVTGGGGSIANASTITGPQGRATGGHWILGAVAGRNTVVAAVAGAGSVEFEAEGIAIPVGRYELTTIDGHSLPVVDPSFGEGQSVVSGSFTLNRDMSFSSSTAYRASGKQDVVQTDISGRFGAGKTGGLVFYLSGPPEWSWATGAIADDKLTVFIGDYYYGTHAWYFVKARTDAP